MPTKALSISRTVIHLYPEPSAPSPKGTETLKEPNKKLLPSKTAHENASPGAGQLNATPVAERFELLTGSTTYHGKCPVPFNRP